MRRFDQDAIQRARLASILFTARGDGAHETPHATLKIARIDRDHVRADAQRISWRDDEERRLMFADDVVEQHGIVLQMNPGERIAYIDAAPSHIGMAKVNVVGELHEIQACGFEIALRRVARIA